MAVTTRRQLYCAVLWCVRLYIRGFAMSSCWCVDGARLTVQERPCVAGHCRVVVADGRSRDSESCQQPASQRAASEAAV